MHGLCDEEETEKKKKKAGSGQVLRERGPHRSRDLCDSSPYFVLSVDSMCLPCTPFEQIAPASVMNLASEALRHLSKCKVIEMRKLQP